MLKIYSKDISRAKLHKQHHYVSLMQSFAAAPIWEEKQLF